MELLYFDGCPSHEALLPRLEAILAEEGLGVSIVLRRVADADTAVLERFLGSPTVRIDGIDVDPAASARTDFGLKCRLYLVGGAYRPFPPDEWIRSRLQRTGEANAATSSRAPAEQPSR